MAVPPNQVKLEKAKSKKKSKMMVGGLMRSAGKGLSRAGKSCKKGVVNAKKGANKKIRKVQMSEQNEEVIVALEGLKSTKKDIYAISDLVRNLYAARHHEATFMIQLSERLKKIEADDNDPFGEYVNSMGNVLDDLVHLSFSHLQQMKEELVVPLEKFRDKEVEAVQKLKLKYKNAKMTYDVASHKEAKAAKKEDVGKLHETKHKKDLAHLKLIDFEKDVMYKTKNLEDKKQTILLSNIDQYWKNYIAFAQSQSEILSKNQIKKGQYTASNLKKPQFAINQQTINMADPRTFSNSPYGSSGSSPMPPPLSFDDDDSDDEEEEEYYYEDSSDEQYASNSMQNAFDHEDPSPPVVSKVKVQPPPPKPRNYAYQRSQSQPQVVVVPPPVPPPPVDLVQNEEVFEEPVPSQLQEPGAGHSGAQNENVQYLSIEEAKAMQSINKESYLNDADFQSEFGMGKEEFYGLPQWRQKALKKSIGFF